MVTVVGLVGGTIVVVALSKDKDVLSATEGILEDGSGTEVDIRVVTGSLVGGRTIKVPDTEVTDVLDGLCDRLGTSRISQSSLDEAPIMIGRH